MARTQRNKATERHFGVLKAKLAKLRRELMTPKGGSSGPGEGFDVAKTGDARIGFVGKREISGTPLIWTPLYSTEESVLIKEVSSFQVMNCLQELRLGKESFLIR